MKVTIIRLIRAVKANIGTFSLVFLTAANVFLTALNLILIYNPYKKENIKVACSNELFIGNELGLIHFTQNISLKNTGDKTAFLTKIDGLVRSKDRDISIFKRKIAADNYYRNYQEGSQPFLEYPLGASEVFQCDLTLVKKPDRVTRDSSAIINSLLLNMVEDKNRVNANVALLTIGATKDISSMIDNFIKIRANELQSGEYEYIIQFTKNNEKSPFETKCYSFFITRDNIFQFNELKKNYTNFSLFGSSKRMNLSIPLTEIHHEEITNSLITDMQ